MALPPALRLGASDACVALADEDIEFRPPAMPTGLQRQRDKARKAVLTPEEVAKLLAAARDDVVNGVYVAFPFLAGTRPSEQLGLLWDDVDFEANVIRIERIQLRDGSLSEFTKTAASVRSIPLSPLLREMLLAWHGRELVEGPVNRPLQPRIATTTIMAVVFH